VWLSITTLTEKHQRLQQKKMKQVFAILAVLIFSKTSYAQNIRGTLDTAAIKRRIGEKG
jgi:hypothetical protein